MREDAVASEGAEPADGEEVTPSSFAPLLAGSADAPALWQVDPETARKREITEAFWAECLAEIRELFGGDEPQPEDDAAPEQVRLPLRCALSLLPSQSHPCDLCARSRRWR